MSREPINLTAKGLEKIKEELTYLKEVKRPELSAYMGKAIEDGDLRESAAYDEARLLQSANETRIADLEEIIHRAVIVAPQKGKNASAGLGASLVLEDSKGEKSTFNLVGTHEADIFENKISDESPMGQALLGKRAGDKVKIPLRDTTVHYTILEVNFD